MPVDVGLDVLVGRVQDGVHQRALGPRRGFRERLLVEFKDTLLILIALGAGGLELVPCEMPSDEEAEHEQRNEVREESQ